MILREAKVERLGPSGMDLNLPKGGAILERRRTSIAIVRADGYTVLNCKAKRSTLSYTLGVFRLCLGDIDRRHHDGGDAWRRPAALFVEDVRGDGGRNLRCGESEEDEDGRTRILHREVMMGSEEGEMIDC